MKTNGIAILLLSAALAAGGGRADETDKEQAKLEGTWKIVRVTYDGEVVPKDRIEGATFVFSKDRLKMIAPKGEVEEYTYRLDASKSPKQIDLTRKKETGRCIYKLDKDTLTIALPDKKEKRPASLESKKGSKVSVMVFERKKK
jgi:uncharacterized protein (TIGR03067 family)